MSKSRGFSAIILLLVIAIPVAFIVGWFFPKEKVVEQKQEVFAEKIPGSRFHSPDGTWWGYNQSKIARYKDLVFSYYIDNDDDSSQTHSRFVILKNDGEKAWEEGAKFRTSRPGNLLIDSKGVLHAFVFEPTDVKTNDSWGRLIHFYFPNSAKGDITNYQQETIVENDGKSETANIRVGAAIGTDDTMAVSFGLTKFNPLYKDQSEHVYYKKPDEQKWNHTFVDGLPHDYYYPFTLVSDNSFSLLPIQDDFVASGKANIYQKILFMQTKDGNWTQELIADLSNHSLAQSRPKLLEQEDLLQDKDGNFHIIYKEFLDEKNEFAPTVHWHVSGKPGNFKSEKINFSIPGVNWVRLAEVDGALYYFATTFGQLYFSPVDDLNLTEVKLPEDISNNYPYVSTPKAGSTESNYVDILLLGADRKLYEEKKNTNYYVRIPKSYLK